MLLVNPESQELLTEMIELVSTATNTQERANELLSYIASQKSMLSDTLADTEPKKAYIWQAILPCFPQQVLQCTSPA